MSVSSNFAMGSYVLSKAAFEGPYHFERARSKRSYPSDKVVLGGTCTLFKAVLGMLHQLPFAF